MQLNKELKRKGSNRKHNLVWVQSSKHMVVIGSRRRSMLWDKIDRFA
jgi:hypothetical protein